MAAVDADADWNLTCSTAAPTAPSAPSALFDSDHPRHLRLRRTRRHLHRPHQRPQQPPLLRDHPLHQPLRRAAPPPLRRLPARLHQPLPPGAATPSPPRPGSTRPSSTPARRHRHPHDGQHHRRLSASRSRLSAARKPIAKRRIGLGMTGLADALMMTVNQRYGSPAAASHRKGDWALPRSSIRAAYARLRPPGRRRKAPSRCSTATPTSPAKASSEPGRGSSAPLSPSTASATRSSPPSPPPAPSPSSPTTSPAASSPSSPSAYTRKVLQPDGTRTEEEVSDYALRRFRAQFGEAAPLPD